MSQSALSHVAALWTDHLCRGEMVCNEKQPVGSSPAVCGAFVTASRYAVPMGAERRTSGRILFVAVAFEAGLGVAAVLAGLVLGYSPLGTFEWSGAALVSGLIATVPMLALFALCWRSDLTPVRRIRERLDELVPLLFGDRSLVTIALVSVAAGVGEELLFRGLLQGMLAGLLGAGPALLIASALFGLGHSITYGYVVLAGLIGAYLGSLWLMTGNLLVPITAHALYDFIAIVAMTRLGQDSSEPAISAESPPRYDEGD